jgi:hypothetical protein
MMLRKRKIGAIVVRSRGRVISQTGSGLNAHGQPTVPATWPAVRTAAAVAQVKKQS